MQRSQSWRFSIFLCAALVSTTGCHSVTDPRDTASLTPAGARIVTEDIPRFWAAFDKTTGPADTIAMRTIYLDSGSAGLRDFTQKRWGNAKTLVSMVWPARAYYQSVRQNTLGVAALIPQIRAAFDRLEALYPDGVYPDVYFTIGGLGTGGTVSNTGLLIGTEMFSRAADTPTAGLTPWQQATTQGIDILPTIVAHELTHYQQRYGNDNSLLAQSINEGCADFVSELLTGKTINATQHTYGDANEAATWQQFSAQMSGTDVSQWLYNGGTVSAGTARPSDMGYYVGYKIVQAYYNKKANSTQALYDILHIQDFNAFLQTSGYGPTR